MASLFWILAALCSPLYGADVPPKLVKELRVADFSAWRALSLDDAGRRLYAASRSNLWVFDLDKGQVVRQVAQPAEIHCFTAVPRYKAGFYGAGDKHLVSSISLSTFRPAPGVETSGRPEVIVADPNSSLGFAFCADHTAIVFETDDADFMKSIPLPGAARGAVLDSKSRRVFCSLENGNQVVSFPASGQGGALSTWSVAPGENPAGLAFDTMSRRLLVGCGNNLLVVMDPTTGKVVDSVTVDSGADVIVFDSTARQVFATGGKGRINVVQLLPEKMLVSGTLEVPPGSRCMAVDSKTHKLYVGSGDGSKILVFGQ